MSYPLSLHSYRNSPIAASLRKSINSSNSLKSSDPKLTESMDRNKSAYDLNNLTVSTDKARSNVSLDELKKSPSNDIKVVSIEDINNMIKRNTKKSPSPQITKMVSIDTMEPKPQVDINETSKKSNRRLSLGIVYKRPLRPILKPQKSIDSAKANINRRNFETINEEFHANCQNNVKIDLTNKGSSKN